MDSNYWVIRHLDYGEEPIMTAISQYIVVPDCPAMNDKFSCYALGRKGLAMVLNFIWTAARAFRPEC
jgi:hypothetical protein